MESAVLFPYFADILILAPGELFFKTKPSGNLDDLPGVGHGLARRRDNLVEMLGAAFGVAEHAFLLDPHGGGQDDIGNIGGRGRVDIGDNDKTVLLSGTVPVAFQVRHGDHGIGHLDPHELDVTPIESPEHLHRMVGGFGINVADGHIPDLRGHLAGPSRS